MNETELKARVVKLSAKLNERARMSGLLDKYFDGDHPVPDAVRSSKAQRAYRQLMDMSRSNWPRLIVESVDERLEVQGIRAGDPELEAAAWEIWQRNQLDADAGIVHQAALTDGRAFLIVWVDHEGRATVTPEHASTVIVEYAPGSRQTRVAALRRWKAEDKKWRAVLYLPDDIHWFVSTGEDCPDSVKGWESLPEKHVVNTLGVVNVVELGVNRALRPGIFGRAEGEFETVLGHIDRINYTVFSWLAAMTWSGFPLRAKIGDPVALDDEGNPIKPFDVAQNEVVLIENPDGKLVQLPEASLTNYIESLEASVKHLAAITKTPAHYLLGQMVNLSADAIRAAEASLIAKVRRHQRSLGEGWEEALRLAVKIDGEGGDEIPIDAEIIWRDPESRSLSERADAYSKLTGFVPEPVLWEKVLGATPTEIEQWTAYRGDEALQALFKSEGETLDEVA